MQYTSWILLRKSACGIEQRRYALFASKTIAQAIEARHAHAGNPREKTKPVRQPPCIMNDRLPFSSCFFVNRPPAPTVNWFCSIRTVVECILCNRQGMIPTDAEGVGGFRNHYLASSGSFRRMGDMQLMGQSSQYGQWLSQAVHKSISAGFCTAAWPTFRLGFC